MMKKIIKDERVRALIGMSLMVYFNGMAALMTTVKRMAHRKKEDRFIELKPLFEQKP